MRHKTGRTLRILCPFFFFFFCSYINHKTETENLFYKVNWKETKKTMKSKTNTSEENGIKYSS